MWLTRLALNNRMAVLMTAMMLILAGARSIPEMPIDLFPNLAVPVLVVGTLYPGASPKDVERSITYPMEKTLATVDNVDHIQSDSREGVSAIQVWFHWDEDLNTGLVQSVQKISQILNQLPPGIQQPFVLKFDISNMPVINVVVSNRTMNGVQLYDLAYNTIEPQLEELPGVSQAPVNGGNIRQININTNPRKMYALSLSPLEVVSAVNNANFLLPSGDIEIGTRDLNLFTNTQILHHLLHTVRNIPVTARKDGQGNLIPVYVKDFASVEDGTESPSNIVLANGKPAVYLGVHKQPGANTVKVVDEIYRALPHLGGLPKGTNVAVSFDQSTYIRQSIRSINHELVLGSFLAIGTIWIFLREFASTLIVGVAIPLSVLVALIFLHFTGQTLNIFTFGGLALAAGRLIDDSIVELENIYRHFTLGNETRSMALLSAAREVATPILSSTIVTVVVLFPVLFLKGVGKQLFSPMALTIALALFASFLVSRTVTPLLCLRYLRTNSPQDGRETLQEPVREIRRQTSWFPQFFSRIEKDYGRLLEQVLHRKTFFFASITAIFVLSLPLAYRIGTEFFPEPDESQFTVYIKTTPGTRIELTTKVARDVEKVIRQAIPSKDIRIILINAGLRSIAGKGTNGTASVFTQNTGPDTALVQVKLVTPDRRKRSSMNLMNRARRALAGQFPGIGLYFAAGGMIKRIVNYGSLGDVVIEISGYSLKTGLSIARHLTESMKILPGIGDIRITPQDFHYPQYNVRIDRVKSALLGMNIRDISSVVLWSFAGNENNPSIYTDPATGNEYNMVVQLGQPYQKSLEDLKNVVLTNNAQNPLLLREVARIRRSSGPNEIDRKYLNHVITITANPVGRPLGEVASEITKMISRTPLPSGFHINLRGQVAEQKKAFTSLTLAAISAVLLVYMVLATQFRSFRDPLAIMFSLPMSLPGILWMLFLTGTHFSTIAFMGIIMTVGIAASNGVLLVDYINRLQNEEGVPLSEAILRGSRTRLRPVLMTSLATILGLVPMAMGLDVGSSNSAPLARTVIGGLGLATPFTLFLVPAAYAWLNRNGRLPEPLFSD